MLARIEEGLTSTYASEFAAADLLAMGVKRGASTVRSDANKLFTATDGASAFFRQIALIKVMQKIRRK